MKGERAKRRRPITKRDLAFAPVQARAHRHARLTLLKWDWSSFSYWSTARRQILVVKASILAGSGAWHTVLDILGAGRLPRGARPLHEHHRPTLG